MNFKLRFVLYIICVVILFFIGIYNLMLSKKNKVKNAYSSLEVMLKKRYDLIPNLVSTVKAYTKHEESVFKSIISLRNELVNTKTKTDIFNKNNMLQEKLDKLLLLVENYPELKSNENYLELQKSLVDIENQISAARRTYNAHVTKYNNCIQIFPNNILAKLYKFEKFNWFEFNEDTNLGVDFNENN